MFLLRTLPPLLTAVTLAFGEDLPIHPGTVGDLRNYFLVLATHDSLPAGKADDQGAWRAGLTMTWSPRVLDDDSWVCIFGWDLGVERRKLYGRWTMTPQGPIDSAIYLIPPASVASWMRWRDSFPPEKQSMTMFTLDPQVVLGTAWRFGPGNCLDLELRTRAGFGLGEMNSDPYSCIQAGATVGFGFTAFGHMRMGIEAGHAWRLGRTDEGTHHGRGWMGGGTISYRY